MKWSKSFIFTSKEVPGDAEIPSHQLMVRGGFIKKLAPGIFTYGPLALRAIRKFEQIVREEHEKGGAIEILMPMVHPREIWEETHRWSGMGDGLLKFRNRNGHEFCLGATHEEAVTDYVRREVKSYRDLPVTLFQIQTKFRDEIRPRFGLLRGREFIMKDAYSFDCNASAAKESYELMRKVYMAIFERLGVKFRIVEADTGSIGGNLSHEFQILADNGEDQLLVASEGDFAANIEICPATDRDDQSNRTEKPLLIPEKFATPGLRTIADLSRFTSVAENQLVKTLFFRIGDDGPLEQNSIAVLLRGCDEVNPIKIKNLLQLSQPPTLLNDSEVKIVSGANPGSCGPVGLKIPIYMDNGVQYLRNFIVGANEDDYHWRNINIDRDFTVTRVADLRIARPGDLAPNGQGVLMSYRGIEVGHIFYLGTKYSQAMKANFLNQEGSLTAIEMGCYGIGISRTVQAVIEQNQDKDGIIWPVSIAPYQVHLCQLDMADSRVNEVTENIYSQLIDRGVEVLYDDRDERAGVKFKDADLLGMPLRVTIGSRGLQKNEVEVVDRRTKSMTKLSPNEIFSYIVGWLQDQGWRSCYNK